MELRMNVALLYLYVAYGTLLLAYLVARYVYCVYPIQVTVSVK